MKPFDQQTIEEKYETISTRVEELKAQNAIWKEENNKLEVEVQQTRVKAADAKQAFETLTQSVAELSEKEKNLTNTIYEKEIILKELFLKKEEAEKILADAIEKKQEIDQNILSRESQIELKRQELDTREKAIVDNEISLKNYRDELDVRTGLLEARERRTTELLKSLQ